MIKLTEREKCLTINDGENISQLKSYLKDCKTLGQKISSYKEGKYVVTVDDADKDGKAYWYKGLLHREDGPASYGHAYNDYYLEGRYFEYEDWQIIMRREKLKELGI